MLTTASHANFGLVFILSNYFWWITRETSYQIIDVLGLLSFYGTAVQYLWTQLANVHQFSGKVLSWQEHNLPVCVSTDLLSTFICLVVSSFSIRWSFLPFSKMKGCIIILLWRLTWEYSYFLTVLLAFVWEMKLPHFWIVHSNTSLLLQFCVAKAKFFVSVVPEAEVLGRIR